jgi:multiple sugar transport system ATP-binding protein
MASISIDGLTKRFGDEQTEIVAVDEVDLDIRDGEFMVFVGPSGSGKSTLLRMVAGLEQQSDGDIYIDETVVNELEPRERDIAMVFQNYALYPNMTVRGNMSFGLKMSTSLDKNEINQQVEDAADVMDIEHLLDNKPSQMSGGQRQRVALGRAIVRDPNVFLLDEPLSNLDAKLRMTMRTEINRLQTELDVTMLYVTHDQTEAMTMGDRLVVLDQGELQQVGTPLECFYKPANRFVAGFIGSPSMNFFDTTRTEETITGGNLSYTLTDEMREAVDSHSEITLGIRPEDMELGESSAGSGSNDRGSGSSEIDCTVDVVEPMGSVKYVYLQAVEQNHDETFVVETEGQRPIDEGQDICAYVPDDAVYLFATNSGRALHHRKLTAEAEADLSSRFADAGVVSE